MRYALLSYYDKKLGIYGLPEARPVPLDGDADFVEQTRRMCANPKMPKIFFEYDLYKIGEYDDKIGSIIVEEKPVFLVSLNDYRYLATEDEEDGEGKN